ncbi:MAG: rod shape-determining protein MreC, partial [Planctomycetota bacterium]
SEKGISGVAAGIVVSTTNSASRVLLITDIAVRIPVFVLETGEEGICEGNADSPHELNLKYIDGSSKIKEGDRIVTSGTAGTFPRGILVGLVTAVKNRGFSPILTVNVQSAVDISKISHVLVLKTDSSLSNGRE